MKKEAYSLRLLALSASAGCFFRAASFCSARAAALAGLAATLLLPPALEWVGKSRCLENTGLRAFFTIPVALAAGQSLRNLCAFFGTAYPQNSSPLMLSLLAIAGAALFARSGRHGLEALGGLLSPLLWAALLIFLFSLCGSLRIGRLQAVDPAEFRADLGEGLLLQLSILPEYFLAVLCTQQGQGKTGHVYRLPAVVAALQFFFVLICELTRGGEPSAWTVYSTACLGQLAVFSRLDVLQILVFSLLLMFRLAVYTDYCRQYAKGLVLWAVALAGGVGLLANPAGTQAVLTIFWGTGFAAALTGGMIRCAN